MPKIATVVSRRDVTQRSREKIESQHQSILNFQIKSYSFRKLVNQINTFENKSYLILIFATTKSSK